MKKIKFYSLFLLAGILFQSCNQYEFDHLKKDNFRLHNELEKLQNKIDNSIVIPPDSISEYLYPMTVSSPTGKTNKEFQFTTYLLLKKLPKNIKHKWNSIPEPMKLTNEYLTYTVYSSYENVGIKSYTGSYILTFPNNKTKKFNWFREFEIVN